MPQIYLSKGGEVMNPKILAQKEQNVRDVEVKAREAAAVIVLEYRGLTVKEIQELRTQLSEINAEVGVLKNGIVRRAATNLGYDEIQEHLVGPNAFVFGTDPINVPRVVYKFARRYDHVNIKAGIIEGRVVKAETLKDLSRLSSREGLLSMFLSVLQAPVRQLAFALDQIRAQKEAN